jgi:hypothetical protein
MFKIVSSRNQSAFESEHERLVRCEAHLVDVCRHQRMLLDKFHARSSSLCQIARSVFTHPRHLAYVEALEETVNDTTRYFEDGIEEVNAARTDLFGGGVGCREGSV